MKNIGLQVLRAKLRGFHAAGSSISRRISKSEKERKNRLWDEKRRLGNHCRNHLIAYGLLRGVPYHQIEQCASNNKPNPQAILDIILVHNVWDAKRGYVKYDLEMVTKLLANPTPPTVTASTVTTSEPSSAPTETPKQGLLGGIKRLLEKRA